MNQGTRKTNFWWTVFLLLQALDQRRVNWKPNLRILIPCLEHFTWIFIQHTLNTMKSAWKHFFKGWIFPDYPNHKSQILTTCKHFLNFTPMNWRLCYSECTMKHFWWGVNSFFIRSSITLVVKRYEESYCKKYNSISIIPSDTRICPKSLLGKVLASLVRSGFCA